MLQYEHARGCPSLPAFLVERNVFICGWVVKPLFRLKKQCQCALHTCTQEWLEVQRMQLLWQGRRKQVDVGPALLINYS